MVIVVVVFILCIHICWSYVTCMYVLCVKREENYLIIDIFSCFYSLLDKLRRSSSKLAMSKGDNYRKVQEERYIYI